MHISIVGLGTMGAALAENLLDHGVEVSGWNLDGAAATALALRRPEFQAADDIEALVAAHASPRTLLLMVPAGAPVDTVLAELVPHLEAGDIIIDAGNSHYTDTARRATGCEAKDIHYVGLGVSGGEDGARHGPSLMFGGSGTAFAHLGAALGSIAASSTHGACLAHVGPAPAGHFVKMLHNGIEYADMQLIAEVYDILARGLEQFPAAIAERFARWNEGPLQSFLVELTARVLRKRDDDGSPLVPRILDRAGQKGTGRWSVAAAVELGVAVPTMAAAVDARVLSAAKPARERHAARYGVDYHVIELNDRQLESALLAAKLFAYVQGFELLARAAHEFGWQVDLAAVARVWTGGCIIRAALLDDIIKAFGIDTPGQPDSATDLLAAPFAQALIAEHAEALREVVAAAAAGGLPVPALSASLAWFDALRSEQLPHNLIQAQRDAFGAHGFARHLSPDTAEHAQW